MEKYTKLQKIRLNDSYILRCTMMNLLIKQGVHKPLIQTVNSVTHTVHVGAAIVTFDLLYATSGRFITFAETDESSSNRSECDCDVGWRESARSGLMSCGCDT